MLKVDSANFRRATAEEVYQAKGNIAWQSLNCLWILCCKVMGTAQIYLYRSNVLKWSTPYPQKFINKFTYGLGFNSNIPFINSIYTFFFNVHYVSDKRVIEALFKHHRNGELLATTSPVAKILIILKNVFPEDQFTEDDFMFTCNKDNTKIYRELIHHVLRGTSIGNHDTLIKNTSEAILKHWNEKCEKGEQINITEQTRLFSSSIITQLMFNTTQFSDEIAESINFINYYCVRQILGTTNETVKVKYNKSLLTFKEVIETILKQKDLPIFNSNHNLNAKQKKALIFILFFAGQETTASLLNYALWDLATNPGKQNSLNTQTDIKNYFNEVIHRFTPAYDVGRRAKEDLCLEYTLEGENQLKKTIFYKKDFITARIFDLAKSTLNSNNHNEWLPFGYGEHTCPGRQLVYREVYLFIETLLKNYSIQTLQTKEIPIVGYITAQLTDDVFCSIKKLK